MDRKKSINEESISKMGIVVNCEKLNVRNEPDKNADIVQIIDASSKVEISLNDSTDEFYKVYTETGMSGYCKKQYVNEI